MMSKKILRKPSFEYEQQYWNKGFSFVAGVDEVGRGAFAGPLVAAAVVFLPWRDLYTTQAINDSKLLSAKIREQLAKIIKQQALFYAIEEVPLSYINTHGIGQAGQLAFRTLANIVSRKYDEIVANKKAIKQNAFFLVDGFPIQGLRSNLQQAIIKGDQKSISIAAASIIAKVHRDSLMVSLDGQYTAYNFKRNKGYGTSEHREAIKNYGLCEFHRTSFRLAKFL